MMEDKWDEKHQGGKRDKAEDYRDKAEDMRDHRENMRDRMENRMDRRHKGGQGGKTRGKE